MIMDEILDAQFQTCYNCSSFVMLKYKALRTLFSLGGIDNMNLYSEKIEELKEYVMKEFEAYEQLLTYDKTILIPKIDAFINNENDSVMYMKFRNKLKFIRNIFIGNKITGRDLSIDNIPEDLNFDIYSALLVPIYIQTFILIKNKINSIPCEVESDKRFINEIELELLISILYKACENDLFEMICLHCNFNIETFPDVRMDLLKENLSTIYGGACVDELINDILLDLIVKDISRLKEMQQLNNCPEDVYEYLYHIARLEVIMSYMDKFYLYVLYNHCCEIGFNNTYIFEDVRKKVKRRLDVEN